jgi:hypothetical protein
MTNKSDPSFGQTLAALLFGDFRISHCNYKQNPALSCFFTAGEGVRYVESNQLRFYNVISTEAERSIKTAISGF